LRLLSNDADFIILDEPTNHLDRKARESVLDFVRRTTKGLLVISHDRELLGTVSSILELSSHGITIYGGHWDDYEAEREAERSRLIQAKDNAENERDRAQHERARKLESQAKRMRKAKHATPQAGLPKILLGARKRAAERTLGKLQTSSRVELEKKVEAARTAFSNLKTDPEIYAEFPETFLPAGKLVFQAVDLNFQYEESSQNLWKENLSFLMNGSTRVSIEGENGSGKTTLLHLIAGHQLPRGDVLGTLKRGNVHYGLIDQNANLLDPMRTVFENAYESTQKSVIETRNLLAQFLFAGKKADQRVSTLSGGERVRAALAKVMISDPAPQLLILDEPTNNLDTVNLEFLEEALSRFQGAMIIVSHDVTFLEKIGLTDVLRLEKAYPTE
jgi:ATPase subunit of ABC transporter with duplicated ATPase domains